MASRKRSAFTLIELLVVIAIIAILAVVVVLTLNPAQLLAQSRDANRVSDMATLNAAVNLYTTDQAGTSGFSLGTSSLTYVSIPDPTATSTAGTNCSGLGGNFATGTTFYDCSASTTYRLVNGQGWIPVNFSTVSAGSPFGSLPADPVNSTSSNEYYSYQTNGNTVRIVALPESQKYATQAGTNPTMFMAGSSPSINGGAWVLVPGNPTFGTNNFYVMKYDAVCTDGKGNALLGVNLDYGGSNGYDNSASACSPSNGGKQIASLPNGNPIVSIGQTLASSYCQSIGTHLITNNEWQTIAWNVENKASNWSGGAVGSGYLYSGHNDASPLNALVADPNDANGYAGEITPGANQKRTLTLSNGAIIWDMSGNLFQLTNSTITGTQQPHGAAAGWNWIEFTAVTTWGGMTQQTAGPINSTWNSTQGIGQIYSENTVDPTVWAIVRGAGVAEYGQAGVESMFLFVQSGLTTSNGLGFRCAR